MRQLAIVGVVMLLGGCAAEAADSESLPAPRACVRVETGASPQAAAGTWRTGNKTWDDDWLAPTSAGPDGCLSPQEADSDGTTLRPQSLNAYLPTVRGEKQGPPVPSTKP
ncbi:MAG TPA: hypothetical protein VLT33_24105 [Labilithrix sp.]|nr:hypothetical protein [Labilithrix sp.]